ncbi:DUF5518 domain-containing protein [Halosimplex amylolyticum]|uniref:DUF5518 domain-containing protein n=1 Tax=Halosimplex amylolyticum TaxID=3396616 RepID=UPI003F562292
MATGRGDSDERPAPETPETTVDSGRRGPLVDAGYGALLTLTLSVVPFSPVAGGAAAAFRGETGYPGGVGLGLLAGVFAALPLALVLVPALRIVAGLGVGIPPSSPAYGLFLGIVAALFLVYTVGLSAAGGLVGVWVRRHTDRSLDPTHWL